VYNAEQGAMALFCRADGNDDWRVTALHRAGIVDDAPRPVTHANRGVPLTAIAPLIRRYLLWRCSMSGDFIPRGLQSPEQIQAKLQASAVTPHKRSQVQTAFANETASI
jgi:hypothetical protein